MSTESSSVELTALELDRKEQITDTGAGFTTGAQPKRSYLSTKSCKTNGIFWSVAKRAQLRS